MIGSVLAKYELSPAHFARLVTCLLGDGFDADISSW